MRLIVNTYNPAEVDGFEHAYIDLNAALAQLILERRAIFNQVKSQSQESANSLTALEFCDYSAVFLSGLPVGTLTPNCDMRDGFDETELTYDDLESYRERTECDRMVITDDAVYWTAYPRHCDRSLTIETVYLEWDEIEKAAGKSPNAVSPAPAAQ